MGSCLKKILSNGASDDNFQPMSRLNCFLERGNYRRTVGICATFFYFFGCPSTVEGNRSTCEKSWTSSFIHAVYIVYLYLAKHKKIYTQNFYNDSQR